MLEKVDLNGWSVKNDAHNGFVVYRETNYDEEYEDDPDTTYEVVVGLRSNADNLFEVRVFDRSHFKNGDKGELSEAESNLNDSEVVNFVEQYVKDHPA
jgi:hypothetical protein